jgi:hypothetical protein
MGLGIEPIASPPIAFRSGDRLIRLEPAEVVTTTWRTRLT